MSLICCAELRSAVSHLYPILACCSLWERVLLLTILNEPRFSSGASRTRSNRYIKAENQRNSTLIGKYCACKFRHLWTTGNSFSYNTRKKNPTGRLIQLCAIRNVLNVYTIMASQCLLLSLERFTSVRTNIDKLSVPSIKVVILSWLGTKQYKLAWFIIYQTNKLRWSALRWPTPVLSD